MLKIFKSIFQFKFLWYFSIFVGYSMLKGWVSRDWLVASGGALAFVWAYFLLTPSRSAKNFQQLCVILGATNVSGDLLSYRIGSMQGKLAERAFRIQLTPGFRNRNTQTVIEMGLVGNATNPSSVGHVLDNMGFMPPDTPDEPTLAELVHLERRPQRSVEDLWNNFEFNSPKLQKIFAKGRLIVGADDIAWGYYGSLRDPQILKALIFFLSRIAAEVEKRTAIWKQTKKNVRPRDIWDFTLGAIVGLASIVTIVLVFLNQPFPVVWLVATLVFIVAVFVIWWTPFSSLKWFSKSRRS